MEVCSYSLTVDMMCYHFPLLGDALNVGRGSSTVLLVLCRPLLGNWKALSASYGARLGHHHNLDCSRQLRLPA